MSNTEEPFSNFYCEPCVLLANTAVLFLFSTCAFCSARCSHICLLHYCKFRHICIVIKLLQQKGTTYRQELQSQLMTSTVFFFSELLFSKPGIFMQQLKMSLVAKLCTFIFQHKHVVSKKLHQNFSNVAVTDAWLLSTVVSLPFTYTSHSSLSNQHFTLRRLFKQPA